MDVVHSLYSVMFLLVLVLYVLSFFWQTYLLMEVRQIRYINASSLVRDTKPRLSHKRTLIVHRRYLPCQCCRPNLRVLHEQRRTTKMRAYVHLKGGVSMSAASPP